MRRGLNPDDVSVDMVCNYIENIEYVRDADMAGGFNASN